MKKLVLILIFIIAILCAALIGFRIWEDNKNEEQTQLEKKQALGDDGLPLGTSDVDFEYEDLSIAKKELPKFSNGKECEVIDIPKEYHDTDAYKEYVNHLDEAKKQSKQIKDDENSLCLIIQELHGLYLVENEQLKEKIGIQSPKNYKGFSKVDKDIPVVTIYEFNPDDFDFELASSEFIEFDRRFTLNYEEQSINFANKQYLERVEQADWIVLYEHPNTFDATWQELNTIQGSEETLYFRSKEGFIDEKRPFLNEEISLQLDGETLNVTLKEMQFSLKTGDSKRIDAPNVENAYISIIFEGIYNTDQMTYTIEVAE